MISQPVWKDAIVLKERAKRMHKMYILFHHTKYIYTKRVFCEDKFFIKSNILLLEFFFTTTFREKSLVNTLYRRIIPIFY